MVDVGTNVTNVPRKREVAVISIEKSWMAPQGATVIADVGRWGCFYQRPPDLRVGDGVGLVLLIAVVVQLVFNFNISNQFCIQKAIGKPTIKNNWQP
jgi:hypothetical protein